MINLMKAFSEINASKIQPLMNLKNIRETNSPALVGFAWDKLKDFSQLLLKFEENIKKQENWRWNNRSFDHLRNLIKIHKRIIFFRTSRPTLGRIHSLVELHNKCGYSATCLDGNSGACECPDRSICRLWGDISSHHQSWIFAKLNPDNKCSNYHYFNLEF